MASLDSLEIRDISALGAVGNITSDAPVALRIRYIGTGAVTSVTVITGTSIAFISTEGTQTFPFAAGLTLNTVGKLVDAINVGNCTEAAGGAIWEAKVLDTLRSFATTTQFVNGAISSGVVDGYTCWDMKVDTSAAKYFAFRLTPNRSFRNLPKNSRRVHLKETVYLATLGGAAVDNFQVFDVDGGVETKLYSALSVSAAAQTINWALGFGHISSEDGHDLVVVLKDAVTLADNAANFLTVSGLIEK